MDRFPEAARLRIEGTLREAIELDEKGKSDESIQTLTALVTEFPESGLTHSYLAWMLSRAGKHREAIQHGRLAVQFEPAAERVSLLFFRVLWSAKEFQLAQEEMKRFSAFGHSEEYIQMMAAWTGGV